MKINYKQQDKYSPDQFQVYLEIDGKKIATDYIAIDNVLRDISYIRHESTNYSYLYGGQFRFEQMLSLPYWDYLFLKGDLHEKEIENIQDGCLLIIALLFVEVYDDVGWSYIYAKQLYDKLEKALKLFQPKTGKQINAVEKIKFLQLHIIDHEKLSQNHPDTIGIQETINENCNWIYKEYVENYFINIAKSFEPNRTT